MMTADIIAKYIGLRVKLRRRFAGLTANQLAEASGIAIEMVKRLRPAGRPPGLISTVSLVR